ncbi:hypothetical protein SAMN06272735_5958 [Streptomyces sp. TLI_55]|uniref:hypothetical protein n=1 Tax=Streptomyces sp. TLI_55 TaxID=1938861 RepID=UPI000BD47791|nr:hypothetical protein [Streptomyces sp. TLI_55]SNX64143.1 hypothetical protein SAMN06272735_5958 [Streptomyces sp. TLI_55]
MRSGGKRGAAAAALLCALAVLLLGGCGTQVAGQGGTAPAEWTLSAPTRSQITGAELGPDQRTVTIDVDVPSGPKPCVRDLKAALTEPVTRNTVPVQVTFTSPSGDLDSGCTKTTTGKARVKLPEPLGHRELAVGYPAALFTAQGAKPPALRLCGDLGCTPPATGCTADSYEQAIKAVDMPTHTSSDAEHCDGKWLVLDLSWRTGPACDDQADSACASRLGDRWFYRAGKSGWKPFFRTTEGGCQAVRDREPAFPTALCAPLEPLAPSLHPTYSPTPTASPSS